ncbi:GNAT family N-acetyltransferase [Pseudonocardia sp. NPDC046786]|uniref:GNAT family N-acetyltransferase n=1 Tax=Pseudonocardia sp. NPDC046786 TaxID=3155471 RepID=UPI0033DFB9C1
MTGTVIRRAVEADVAAVAALLADDGIGAGRESADDLAPYLAAFATVDADPSELLVVAERDGAVVGTLQLSLLPGLSRRGALRAQIEGVRVAGTAQGAGLGETLLRWAVDEARRSGCALVQLTSDARRTEAHRFYQRLGFEASHLGYKLSL